MSDERLLSTGEAAKELKLSARSLARWAKEKKVTPVRRTPGGQYRWDLAKLRKQIDAIGKEDD